MTTKDEIFCERHGGRKLTEDEYCAIKEIQVVNRHHGKAKPGVHRVYVGRPTALGNPFTIGKDGSREEVIEKYQKWLGTQLYRPTKACDQFITLVEYMMTECYMELECSCAPQACHADIIREAVFEDDWLWK